MASGVPALMAEIGRLGAFGGGDGSSSPGALQRSGGLVDCGAGEVISPDRAGLAGTEPPIGCDAAAGENGGKQPLRVLHRSEHMRWVRKD
jgi:hypothetical protein